MQVETQNGLETSKAFLKDCIEFSHLMLKQKLEALKRGETVEWKEAADIMREGRAAARQVAQIAGLEIRDAAPKRKQAHHARAAARDPRLTPENLQFLMEGVLEWNTAVQASKDGQRPPVPEKLRIVLERFDLDPALDSSIEALFEIVEAQTQAVG